MLCLMLVGSALMQQNDTITRAAILTMLVVEETFVSAALSSFEASGGLDFLPYVTLVLGMNFVTITWTETGNSGGFKRDGLSMVE